jgi:hypothetical protein
VAKKRKTASARLSEKQKSSRANPFLGIKFDWNNPTDWAKGAQHALDLDSASDESNTLLKKAFEKFGLDWHDPYHWRLLLQLYVQAHVPRGRPTEWTDERLCALLHHINDARRANRNLKRREEIYRLLVKRGAPYAGKNTDYVEYGHKKALDPKSNKTLRMYRDEFVREAMYVHRASYNNNEAPPAVKQKIEEIALDDALTKIGAPYGGWENKRANYFQRN